MQARPLEECAALVVGGTGGIGHACARALLAAGVPRMVLAGRSAERGEAARAALADAFPHADVAFLQCDARDALAAQAMADAAAERMGGIDVLVSAGGGEPTPRLLHLTPIEEMMPILTSLVAGITHPARAVLPHMTARGGGSVICFASDAAKVATPGETVVGAGMAAIVMFCRGMAYEAKRNGIRVNCLTPSVVRGTGLYDHLMADPFCNRIFGKAETLASLGVVEPEDLASMVVYLAGPASARMTGQTISINGGISAA
ncbi:MAG: SDR family oxidoreductase [Alphaproteobacteria bacterium]|nr:SDR family oxidoreductase [Alphaproteobacteria bacterium]